MSGLSFLQNITLASNEQVRPAFTTSKSSRASAVDRTPSGNRIRVFKNGAVYPSKSLSESFGLEYQSKDSVVPSFGLDILSSAVYPNTSHLAEAFLICAIVLKSAGKVDLFGSTKFVAVADKDLIAEGKVVGDPKSSVLDQGAATFGKETLIPMLKEVYGFEFTEDQKFVDLEIVLSTPLVNPDGNYFIPKTISRGENIGKLDVVVRKDIKMFPIVLASALVSEEGVEIATETIEEAQVPEINMVTEDVKVEAKIEAEAPKVTSTAPTIEELLEEDLDLQIENDPDVEEEGVQLGEDAVTMSIEDDESASDAASEFDDLGNFTI